MNIFVLDTDPFVAAKYHCNKHTIKMVIEVSQLLSTAVKINSPLDCCEFGCIYEITHKNHPCNIWARKSRSNFEWLISYGLGLSSEYTFRYGKTHASEVVIKRCINFTKHFPDIGLTPFAQAMPDKYKNEDVVKAYRDYYIGEKQHILHYTKREIPYWLKEHINV